MPITPFRALERYLLLRCPQVQAKDGERIGPTLRRGIVVSTVAVRARARVHGSDVWSVPEHSMKRDVMLVSSPDSSASRAVIRAQDGPAGYHFAHKSVLLAGSVGKWLLVGIACALNDIEREEPRQEMLLPPCREV
jgi:hypothetical protein